MKWVFAVLNLVFALVFIPIFRSWMKDILQEDGCNSKRKDDRLTVSFSNMYLGICFCIARIPRPPPQGEKKL